MSADPLALLVAECDRLRALAARNGDNAALWRELAQDLAEDLRRLAQPSDRNAGALLRRVEEMERLAGFGENNSP